ncbi:MAG: hypothetical protein FRX49_11892 [Trebouxia sp. A1-2]|nr:MAG: hypothetical protein FRX49_11892 [Trebouxia sp. A1-2]
MSDGTEGPSTRRGRRGKGGGGEGPQYLGAARAVGEEGWKRDMRHVLAGAKAQHSTDSTMSVTYDTPLTYDN